MKKKDITTGQLVAIQRNTEWDYPTAAITVGPIPVEMATHGLHYRRKYFVKPAERGSKYLVLHAPYGESYKLSDTDAEAITEKFRQHIESMFAHLNNGATLTDDELKRLKDGDTVWRWEVVPASRITGTYLEAVEKFKEIREQEKERRDRAVENRLTNVKRIDAAAEALRARGLNDEATRLHLAGDTRDSAQPEVTVPLSALESLLNLNR